MRTPDDDTQALYDDKTAGKWLNTIVKGNTRRTYVMGLKHYLAFTNMTPAQLIDEAVEDMKKDPRESQDIVVKRLIDFYNWLKTDYQSYGAEEKGISDKAAATHVISIRSFYAAFRVNIRLKGRTALPKPKVQNKRLIVNAEQVKQLLNYAPNIRDRAIMLTLFQSGMDVSTLCGLKYGDIEAGLQSGDTPLILDLQREKTGVEFQTFLGRSSVDAIRTYIKDREARGFKFAKDSPLFVKESKMNGKDGKPKGMNMDPELVQLMMKAVASKAGFVDSKGYNVLGPHALRESFGSIMINAGVPDSVVDFWLGHSIGEMAKAYKQVQGESVRKMYAEREKLIDPYTSIENGKTIHRVDVLSDMFNEESGKRKDLEKAVVKMEGDMADMMKKIESQDKQIELMQKVIEGLGLSLKAAAAKPQ